MITKKVTKRLTKTQAKKKAYKAFQECLRAIWTKKGYAQCYTCGKKINYKETQVGHWIEGHANAVYINEDYVRPQDRYCNIMLHGNQGVFRDKLRKELGDAEVDRLILEAKLSKEISVSEYLELETFYKAQLQALKDLTK